MLLLQNGWLVQSKGFCRYQNLGNPTTAVKRLSQWAADEVIYLDISKDNDYDMRRDDMGHPNRSSFLEIIKDVSEVAFMPLCVGGRIRTIADIEMRLSLGADKITLNTKALEDTPFVTQAAKEFGSQCIVISIDVKETKRGYRVFAQGGTQETSYTPEAWAREVSRCGAGEIFLNSIDRDGAQVGYDLALIERVARAVAIPVIACGGAGEFAHFGDVLEQTAADAVAAANIFHYRDQSVYLAKKYLYERGLPVRPPELLSV